MEKSTLKTLLSKHSLILYSNGTTYMKNGKGIAPIMECIRNNIDLNGFSVADLIVGKAVALLFVYCGIKKVYAKTISEAALKILETYKIEVDYEEKVKYIINGEGNDKCPMELAVESINDCKEGYEVLMQKIKEQRNKTNNEVRYE